MMPGTGGFAPHSHFNWWNSMGMYSWGSWPVATSITSPQGKQCLAQIGPRRLDIDRYATPDEAHCQRLCEEHHFMPNANHLQCCYYVFHQPTFGQMMQQANCELFLHCYENMAVAKDTCTISSGRCSHVSHTLLTRDQTQCPPRMIQ